MKRADILEMLLWAEQHFDGLCTGRGVPRR